MSSIHDSDSDKVPAVPDLTRPHEDVTLSQAESIALEGHAAAYALDALTKDEAREFELHLRGCAFCSAAVAEFDDVVGQLPEAIEPLPAAPALKQRLMDAVRADIAAARSITASAGAPTGARLAGPPTFNVPGATRAPGAAHPLRPVAGMTTFQDTTAQRPATTPPVPAMSGPASAPVWMAWQPPRWLAATLLVASLGLGAWNVSLLRSAAAERDRAATYEAALATAAGGRVVPLASTSEAAGRSARVALITPAAGTAATSQESVRLVVAGLPPAAADRTYQLWLIQDGTPRDAGTFGGASGVETVAVKGDPSRAQVVAVTVEPRGGSSAPTSQPILAARL